MQPEILATLVSITPIGPLIYDVKITYYLENMS